MIIEKAQTNSWSWMIWALSIISAEAESEDNSGVCDATLRTITRIVVVMIDIFSCVVIGTY